MTDELNTNLVFDEGTDMAEHEHCDLPTNIMVELLRIGASTHQEMMAESLGNLQHTNNLLRSITAKKFDEVGPTEASANLKVLGADGKAIN